MASADLYRHSILDRNAAYGAIARIYDRLMAHVEYDRWLWLIKTVCRRYARRSRCSIFEIGGGTGALGSMLRREGFHYFGSDYSASMCASAVHKQLPFFCADGRRLPLRSQFDIILFLYDGINYLIESDDYALLFSEVARCLHDGGLFLFDITTEANSLAHFYDYIDFDNYEDGAYIRHSYYDQVRKYQHNDFTIFCRSKTNPERFSRHFERHCQRVVSISEMKRMIPKQLFSIEGVWDGYSLRAGSPKSDRVHFLLSKKPSV
jgi:SAM-dependent methyltransferase